jgi:DNA-binding CsgD family transcriptional regulator
VSSEEILDLVRERSSPGILVLGNDNRLLYTNREASSFLKDANEVPPEVLRLCDRVRAGAAAGQAVASSELDCALLPGKGDASYSLRAFVIGTHGNNHPPTHVMVLVERVVEHRALNLKKARTTFGLTRREIEVVMLVAQGWSNKEIGARLFLSEYTVKDHIKNIMGKVNASSRSEIVAILK